MQSYKGNDSNDIDDLASSFRPNPPFWVVCLATSLTGNIYDHFNQVAEVDADLNDHPSNITFLRWWWLKRPHEYENNLGKRDHVHDQFVVRTIHILNQFTTSFLRLITIRICDRDPTVQFQFLVISIYFLHGWLEFFFISPEFITKDNSRNIVACDASIFIDLDFVQNGVQLLLMQACLLLWRSVVHVFYEAMDFKEEFFHYLLFLLRFVEVFVWF
jgi:hypothetical protein